MEHFPTKQAQIDYQHLEEVRQVVEDLIKSNAALSSEFMRRYQINDNSLDLEVSGEFCKLIEVLRDTEKVIRSDSELHKLLVSRLPISVSIWTRFLRFVFSVFGVTPSVEASHHLSQIHHQTRM